MSESYSGRVGGVDAARLPTTKLWLKGTKSLRTRERALYRAEPPCLDPRNPKNPRGQSAVGPQELRGDIWHCLEHSRYLALFSGMGGGGLLWGLTPPTPTPLAGTQAEPGQGVSGAKHKEMGVGGALSLDPLA